MNTYNRKAKIHQTDSQHRARGFTLIELMIVIAIIGILAAVAVPQYVDNVRKSKFAEIKLATAPVKKALESCYELNNGNVACNTIVPTPTIRGQLTPATLASAQNSAIVQSVTVTGSPNPIITVTSLATSDLAGKTYILTGNVVMTGTDAGITSWAESGTGCIEGWC